MLTPHTTKTRTKPRKNSIPKPWRAVTSDPRAVTPSFPAARSGVKAFRRPEPAAAPAHCAITYRMARAGFTLPAEARPAVTAGFM